LPFSDVFPFDLFCPCPLRIRKVEPPLKLRIRVLGVKRGLYKEGEEEEQIYDYEASHK
jgi:hypothetical protein